MIKMNQIVEKAVSHFREGFNCAESVLMAYVEVNNIESKIIPIIATGFGGGIGRRGSVCGALNGAIMALGLKYGRDKIDLVSYDLCVSKCSQCYEGFKNEFGSVFCRDLTGCDLSTNEGRVTFKEHRLKELKCVKYVESASKIVLNLTQE